MDIINLNFQLDHIGINHEDEEQAENNALLLNALFGFPLRNIPASVFANEQIELMKAKGRGTMGHFAISTINVSAAQKYLESKGVEFDESSASFNESGEKLVIYAKQELSGFAWHLMKR